MRHWKNALEIRKKLLFRREGDRFELAIEARIPDELRVLTARPELGTARYEVAIGLDETERQFEFKAEKFLLKEDRVVNPEQTRVCSLHFTIFPILCFLQVANPTKSPL